MLQTRGLTMGTHPHPSPSGQALFESGASLRPSRGRMCRQHADLRSQAKPRSRAAPQGTGPSGKDRHERPGLGAQTSMGSPTPAQAAPCLGPPGSDHGRMKDHWQVSAHLTVTGGCAMARLARPDALIATVQTVQQGLASVMPVSLSKTKIFFGSVVQDTSLPALTVGSPSCTTTRF